MFTAFGATMEKFDFLGQTVNFRINNSPNIKTSCGGISSVIILMTLGFIVYLFFLPLIKGLNPDVKFVTQKEIFPQRTNLTNENFLFGFHIENSDYPLINLTEYVDIKLINYVNTKYIDSNIVKSNKTTTGILFFFILIFCILFYFCLNKI